MKKKKDKVIDFGEWLYAKRKQKGYSEEELVELLKMPNIQVVNIRKWERDLEFPNLEEIYKLSEIYMVPSQTIIEIKNKTLEEGVLGVHKQIIRWISFFMGISIYGTIWFCRIVIWGSLILAWVWFYFKTKPM